MSAATFAVLASRWRDMLSVAPPPPPPLALSILRGEAILRLRFIAYFETVGLGLDEPARLWALWNNLVLDRGRILDLVNRIGLIAAVSTQVQLPKQDEELAYQMYCGLLNDLERNEEYRLLEIASDYFFRHAFFSLFPNKVPETKLKMNAESLRSSVMSRLSKKLKRPFELKESFRQAEDAVEFRLRLKLDGQWNELPVSHGKRLKPTRLDAYQQLLDALGSGSYLEWIKA